MAKHEQIHLFFLNMKGVIVMVHGHLLSIGDHSVALEL